jgi:ribonucleoside-diphosphate reductase alpha chain
MVSSLERMSRVDDWSRADVSPGEIARALLERAGADPIAVDQLLREALPLLGGPAGIDSEASIRAVEAVLVETVLQNLHLEPDLEPVALRLRLRDLYRQALGDAEPGEATYRRAFPCYIRQAVSRGLLDRRLLDFELEALAARLVPERDELLTYTGLATLIDRYLLRELEPGDDPSEDSRLLETPQFFWMRVAMGLALNEDDPTTWAARFYEVMSTLRVVPSTPTLFNAGTPYPQLASCYLADVEDSMDSILASAEEFGQLAKYAGGLGASLTKLRAAGSPVRGVNGRSSGVIPFAHFYDALINAVNQGGRRRGTLAIYLEPWHLELPAFLDLKKNDGDPYQRARRANTALWIPDLFMKQVMADGDWYLFDPAVAPELSELYGPEFEAAYWRLAERAERGELPPRAWRKLRARELFREILATMQETSHPWLVFKDAGNLRSPLRHAGVVHSSNLCTEVFLPTSSEEIAVCNLASVNLVAHLTSSPGTGLQLDEQKLAESVRTAIRMLDNVIDINFYPVERARRSNLQNRPVGLGVMGFADAFARLGMAYGDEASEEWTDRVVELISFHAIAASAELARERGPFPRFAGSAWSAGRLPIDTLDDLEAARGRPVTVDRSARLPWEELRAEVARGMRNGTVMAIAPTASISLIAGTSPSLDPYYAALFTRQNLSGKFLEVNRALVDELKARGLWEAVRERLVEERGDLRFIDEIPEDLKRRFPTAYQVPPEAYVRLAARAQKWVDMGISRNLYFQERALERMEAVYLTAWELGLKSTYYVFMAPRMYAEQSTVRVNKAVKRPRWNLEEHLPAGDPAADLACEVCQ